MGDPWRVLQVQAHVERIRVCVLGHDWRCFVAVVRGCSVMGWAASVLGDVWGRWMGADG